MSVGTFQTPWAKDASGALVPTHYIVQGSTLIQQVDVTSATTFPVVADPMFVTVGSNGIDFRLTLNEQTAAATGYTIALGLALCALQPEACPYITIMLGAVTWWVTTYGVCPSSDYLNVFKGWLPWDRVVFACIRY